MILKENLLENKTKKERKEMSTIYFIIGIMIFCYIIWTWRSTKELESYLMRASYLVIGTLFITIVTLILFQISKIGIEYPKQEMVGEVRKIILLIFVPINGLIVLTQSVSIFTQVKNNIISKKQLNKRIKILAIIFIEMIVFECFYFKSIQTGIISMINK